MGKRMIDADALLKLFPDEIEILQTYNAEVQHLIDSQPTIDAIPVSYIEKEIEDNIKLADSIRAKGGEEIADVVLRYAMNLKVFLMDWRKGERE